MDGSVLRSTCAATMMFIVAIVPGSIDAAEGASAIQNIELRCVTLNAAQFAAMETAASPSSCWYHIGHHHYWVGRDTTYRLWGGSGVAFVVEQHAFSPSTGGLGTAQHPGVTGVVTEVPIETSMDGLAWTQVAHAEFRVVAGEATADPGDLVLETVCDNSGNCEYREATNTLACIGSCEDTYWRQWVRMDFTASGQEFRYIRFSNPPSIYTGLSGFLDSSIVTIQAEPFNAVTDPALVARTDVPLDCATDILEDFFADRPCTFGGYVLQDVPAVGEATHVVGNHPGQWDSPSFYHTYPIGNGSLDEIAGSAHVRDWRNNAVPATQGIRVQTSTDGEAWTTVHTFPVARLPPVNGLPNPEFAGSFSVSLTDHDARFVRLVAETMPSWATTASNKHPWAFFLGSGIELTGDLPASL